MCLLIVCLVTAFAALWLFKPERSKTTDRFERCLNDLEKEQAQWKQEDRKLLTHTQSPKKES